MLATDKKEEDVRQALVDGEKKIRSYVKKFSLNPHDEADCIQESIVRVLEQARESRIRNPVAYAVSVAKHIVFKKNSEALLSEEDLEEQATAFSLEDSMEQVQRLKHVNIALSRMPELRRTVLIRKRYFGESRKEISSKLGISEEAVKKHITRAMADLLRYMDSLQK